MYQNLVSQSGNCLVEAEYIHYYHPMIVLKLFKEEKLFEEAFRGDENVKNVRDRCVLADY